MYRSSEVRWFFSGDMPNGIRDWFVVGDHVRSEPTRSDEYILLPDCKTASMKIREGRFEVKARTAAPQPVTFSTDIEGFRDNWVKWSSNAIDDDVLQQLVGSADDSKALITKQRCLRTYSLDGDAPEEVDGSQIRLSNGCQIELTKISVSGAPREGRTNTAADGQAPSNWWSLSFEAFGEPDRMMDNLDRIAELIFREPPPVPLPQSASMSYPAWLSQSHRRAATGLIAT